MIDCDFSIWKNIISNSGLATWVMYAVLAGIGLYGLTQIILLRLQSVSQTYALLFDIIYTDEMIRIKEFLRHNEIIKCLNDLKHRLSGKTIPPEKEYEWFKVEVNNQGKKLKGRFHKTVNLRDIDRLLTAYNHIGLMIEKGILTLDFLPTMTHKNLSFYWDLLEPYIKLRRCLPGDNKEYAKHFETWLEIAKQRKKTSERLIWGSRFGL